MIDAESSGLIETEQQVETEHQVETESQQVETVPQVERESQMETPIHDEPLAIEELPAETVPTPETEQVESTVEAAQPPQATPYKYESDPSDIYIGRKAKSPKQEKPPTEETSETEKEPVPVPAQPAQQAPGASSSFSTTAPAPSVYKKKEKSDTWKRLEKQFLDNWTGILGSVILVIGIVFISVYAAFKMKAMFRFVMLSGVSGLFFTAFFLLRAKTKWLKLATWMRSSGCAVFLFACLGAGHIPGLKWIDSTFYALLLLLVGVVLNLAVGTFSGSQFFTSFHAIISLAALAAAPQSALTLGIVTAICLVQVIMTYKDRWEYHLLVTITAFMAYHLYWFFSLDLIAKPSIPLQLRITGIAAAAVIGIATAFVHYRKIYAGKLFDPLPFMIHLLNWFFMGTGFYVYSTGSKWNTILLTASALAAFLFSRRAKKIQIRWLFVTDTLIAQSLAMLAVLTLYRWHLNALPIVTILMMEIMLFLVIMMMEKEKILEWIGGILFHFSGFVVMLTGFVVLYGREFSRIPGDTPILAAAFIIYTAFHFYLVRKKSESFDSFRLYGMAAISDKFSLSGVQVGGLFFVLFCMVFDFIWAPIAAAAVICALIVLRNRLQLIGLQVGIYMMLAGVYIAGWVFMLEKLTTKSLDAAIYGFPFLVIAFVGSRLSFNQRTGTYRKYLWIYLFSIHLFMYSLVLLKNVSTLVPGVVWLLLAPIYLEYAFYLMRKYGTAAKAKGEPHRFLFHWGYIFMAFFIIRHLTVHIQANVNLGGLDVRLWQELLALAVFIYWAMARKPEDSQLLSWKYLHPLMWELTIVFAVITVGLEVRDIWYPVAWVVGAILLMFLGNAMPQRVSRFRFYSVFLYWTAAFHVAFVSTMDQTPETFTMDQPWFGGLVALVLLMVYMTYFYLKADLAEIQLPPPVAFLKGWSNAVGGSRHFWVFYPFFLAVALFLFWTFDSSILTLLWMVEIFAIFTVSIVLQENHFRYVSYMGLAGCLIRLIFYDLAQSSTLTKALVFMGVGGIMIVMNILYNKYKTRFQHEE